MIFIGGISPRIKPAGVASGTCPACGRAASIHVSKKYSVVTLFFIPVIPYGTEYIATCSSCASVMLLQKEKGRAVEHDPAAVIDGSELQILKNNVGTTCPGCNARISSNRNYCPTCGERL